MHVIVTGGPAYRIYLHNIEYTNFFGTGYWMSQALSLRARAGKCQFEKAMLAAVAWPRRRAVHLWPG